MTKLFIVLFGLLTLGAAYLTSYDVGVAEATVNKHSARAASLHGGYRGGGGYRHGK